MSYNIMSV